MGPIVVHSLIHSLHTKIPLEGHVASIISNCTSGLHGFILFFTLGHVGGGNSCGGDTLLRVTTHDG